MVLAGKSRSVLEMLLTMEDKSSKELKKVDSNLGKVDKATKKASAGVKGMHTSLLKMGAVLGGVTAGVVVAGKALYELGARGAAVQQTTDSYEGLIDKLEVTPDLLEMQRKAVRGTVDDMTLMSATQTLLAGTTDAVGKELAEATPRLLEIAKAANKLNPSLGDTAFLYESITAGIKRGSPQVLDNLGIITKLGKAQSNYAEQLGITVEELSAEQKTIALLNDVTEESGKLLIAQAGGVDSATDSFKQMESSIKNLKDSWSTLIAAPMADAADVASEIIEGIIDTTEANELLTDGVKAGIFTWEEWRAEVDKTNRASLGTAETIEWVAKKTEEWRQELGLTDDQLVELEGHERAYTEAVEGSGEAMDTAAQPAEEFAKRLAEVNQKAADAIQNLRDLKQEKIEDYFDVDLGVGGLAAQLFDITQFKQLGGESLTYLVGQVQAALVEGKITPEQAREFFQNIAIEAEAIKIQMGEVDVDEAAQSIADDFNIPLEEAQGLIEGVLGGIDLINNADITLITSEFDALQERKEILMEIGEIPLEADPNDKAKTKLTRIEDQLMRLTENAWIMELEIQQKGAIPSGVKGNFGAPGGKHGLDMVVPHGFNEPRNPFWIGASSGEEVNITPRGQQPPSGQPITVNINNPQINSEIDIDNMARQVAEVIREKGK
jgi:hypothetical protein